MRENENSDRSPEHEKVRVLAKEYLDDVSLELSDSVISTLFTGSVSDGPADRFSDIDIIVVFAESKIEKLGNEMEQFLKPTGAKLLKHSIGYKCKYRWKGRVFDILIRDYQTLLNQEWEIHEKWNYDNSEIRYDTDGMMESLLAKKIQLRENERQEKIQQLVKQIRWLGQTESQKWLKRGSVLSAHHAVNEAMKAAVKLLYLREGKFIPRDKHLFEELNELQRIQQTDIEQIKQIVKIEGYSPKDIENRLDLLESVWELSAKDLADEGIISDRRAEWRIELNAPTEERTFY